MIGRNDPCPCGSGKKYKKCCQSKEAISVETVHTEELERILQTFYDEYPERKDIPEYLKLANEWKQSLGTYLPEEEMIEAIVLDEFFFHHRPDIWIGYLDKQRKKQLRPSVLRILDTWQQPRAFIGEVIDVDDAYITVKLIFNEEVVRLRRENEKPIPVGVHLFCFILPDETGEENQYLAVSSLLFFPTDHAEVFEEFAKQFESQEQKVNEFIKENTIKFWLLLGKNGYQGGEFTEFEAGVLLDAMDFLEKHDRNPNKLLEIVEDFLVEQQPNARKETAIAAGAIRFGQEHSFYEPLSMTMKEIAEWFGVSPSSMNKYYKELDAYYRSKITN
ncbi:SEC-C domain-containing protein [Sporosarcina sp. ACRSL]|uniref:YecA family protein n=1 Tax=Sporosarcina sp. ACRSL TaxID=2918215 RepID=UPI001EF70252|nr:SEC-C metal-binding domain-containing protein [Sporosarcina sp. ACRSL]MCG7345705.1 SEC-C domain-containing protein [Sporosarcina sp. ACRSL]